MLAPPDGGPVNTRHADGAVVCVAGAGLTGASWAGLFAAAGMRVRLFDVVATPFEHARRYAEEAARFLVAHHLADQERAARGIAALTATTDPHAAFDGAAVVQECVREDLATKQEVFALAGRLTPPEALLATSSSGLSISAIQVASQHPQRCLAAHPYNPPHVVPLVELAPGEQTSPETMERARAFYLAAGKEPVVLAQDVPGYIANRLSAALWREAIDLVRRGIASVEDVDRAVSLGPGLRWAAMGPHLIYDLGGGPGGIRAHMDHLAAVKEGMLRDLATWVKFPDDVAQVLESGLQAEKGAADFDSLCRWRDNLLASYVRARKELGEPSAPSADAAESRPSG